MSTTAKKRVYKRKWITAKEITERGYYWFRDDNKGKARYSICHIQRYPLDADDWEASLFVERYKKRHDYFAAIREGELTCGYRPKIVPIIKSKVWSKRLYWGSINLKTRKEVRTLRKETKLSRKVDTWEDPFDPSYQGFYQVVHPLDPKVTYSDPDSVDIVEIFCDSNGVVYAEFFDFEENAFFSYYVKRTDKVIYLKMGRPRNPNAQELKAIQ